MEAQWFSKTEKIQTNFSWQKANGCYFWERNGVLLVAFMNPSATITSL